ncbi:MAG: ferrous iron transport protein A [Anaerolineales bacterium]|jgi:Fe2+ transport system protein FeoA
MTTFMACPLCGHTFNPAEEPGCATCPLHSGCTLLVCCPACGYKTVDAHQSWLARMALSLMPGAQFNGGDGHMEDRGRRFPRFFRRRGRHRRWRQLMHNQNDAGWRLTLLDVPPGHRVKIEGFATHLSPARKSQLQAYGLVPGYWVEVLQHSPVTVVKIDHSEVAMENDLAGQVWVAAGDPGQVASEE